MTVNQAVGIVVGGMRRRKNMSQGKLAKAIGMTRQHIAYIEVGKVAVKIPALHELDTFLPPWSFWV
jgi:DNA-binding XRE family transcriptional regulator